MGRTGQAIVAEFAATLAFVFVGAGAVLVAGPAGSGLLGVALAHGLVLAAVVAVTTPLSGGHVNPAVTAAFWVVGKIGSAVAIALVAAQLAGAIAGALLLRLAVPTGLWAAANGGTPTLNTGAGMTIGKGVLLEAVLTFVLVLTALHAPSARAGVPVIGPVVGLVFAAGVLAGGPLTGAAMNPARALGPALVAAAWSDWWIWWIGPLAGGVLAGLVRLALALSGPGGEPPGPDPGRGGGARSG